MNSVAFIFGMVFIAVMTVPAALSLSSYGFAESIASEIAQNAALIAASQVSPYAAYNNQPNQISTTYAPQAGDSYISYYIQSQGSNNGLFSVRAVPDPNNNYCSLINNNTGVACNVTVNFNIDLLLFNTPVPITVTKTAQPNIQ